jgi:hypothetical protein
VDGDNRVGANLRLALLELNHIEADFSGKDVVCIGLELASSEIRDRQSLELILARAL